jgi:hypothetical protein
MNKLQTYHVSKYISIYLSIHNVIIFLALFIAVNFLFAGNSYAASQSIRVSPIISDLQLFPGKTTVINLNVENLSNSPIGIHTEISGLDETNQNIFTDLHPSVLTQWTTVSVPDVILDPLSQKPITVNITVPKNAKQNGYYETIFLTPIISSQKQPSAPIVLTRIGAIILGTVGKLNYDDLAKKVGIVDFRPEKYISEKSPVAISFSVENKYFTHFTAKPFLVIKPLFGQENTSLLEEKHVLPGTTKSWEFQASLKKNIFYRARLAVSVGNGEQILSETWFVVLPHYKKILASILIFLIICVLLFAGNRFKKAVKMLFGKN